MDTGNWKLQLVYADTTEQTLPFLGNTFEIEEDSIILNPYDKTPLVALVKFDLPVPGKIRLCVHGRTENNPDLIREFDEFRIDHAIPVLGLYADFDNTLTLTLLDKAGNERISKNIQIRTEPPIVLESGEMIVDINNYTAEQKKKFFTVQNAVYDTEGYVRWYTLYRGNKYFPLSNHLIAIQLFGDKGDLPPQEMNIGIMNFLGQVVEKFDVPNRNHHEINEKSPGGNLLVATNSEPYYTTADDTEDMVVEIDRVTGQVIREWDLRDIFDPSRTRLWTEMPNDWCHLNSIEYDSTDNTLLISSKLQYFISKIDYNSGQIKWIFGSHVNWKEPWQPYLLEPLNFDTLVHPNRDWSYAQHMPRLTDEGNVIVYDNGRRRPGGDFTRILEFRVDETNMTVEKVWTHDFSFSTRTMGSVHIYDDGNVLIGHGEKGILLEVNREGDIVFGARMKYYYRAYPIEFY